jgi:two-component system nitrogen regulation sensor histidine kinase GlnL
VIKDSITLAETKMRRGAVSINTAIESDVPELLADPHQLRQLFSNLLANAFEALGGEGHVDIRAWLLPGEEDSVRVDPQPPQVVVEVHDSGPGIGPEDMERIFSPFFSTKPQGTGLGLAIVRNVVDAHDGPHRRHVGAGPRHDLQSHAAGRAIRTEFGEINSWEEFSLSTITIHCGKASSVR